MTNTKTPVPSIAKCKCGTVNATAETVYDFVPCNGCGRQILMVPVIGKHSASRECDERCSEGHGKKCTCSCGGANHGSAWRVK